jgi:hypothetical protein
VKYWGLTPLVALGVNKSEALSGFGGTDEGFLFVEGIVY